MAISRIPKIVWTTNTLEFGWPLDAAVSWSEPAEGSEFGVNPSSGEFDAWIVREEPRLAATVRWIPTANAFGWGTVPITGWDGATGFNEFLKWARLGGNTFAFHPDRDSPTSITSRLVQPLRGEPPMERDGTRTFRMVIASVGVSPTEYTGY